MRLKKHIDNTLNEKVNKKEKEEALKNDNILIGAEFEFKLDSPLADNEDTKKLYEYAIEEFREYNNAIDDYQDELEEFHSDTSEMEEQVDETDNKITEYENYISNMEDSISEYEDEIEEIKKDKENGTWEPPPKSRYDKIIKTPEEEIEIIQDKIDGEYDDIQDAEDEIKSLQNKSDSIQDEINSREGREYEYVELPYTNLTNYYEYMGNYMGYPEDTITPEPGEKLQYEPYPYDTEVDVVSAIENSEIMRNAPFDDWEAGDYGSVVQKPGSDTWAVEDDGSISGDDLSGLEVKSPPMELPDFMEILPDVLEWINDYGYTDNSTGFHVHMSLKDNASLDVLKLVLFTEESYIYKIFPDRLNNSYVKSLKDKLKSKGSLNKNDLKKLGIEKKLMLKFSTEHSDAINIRDLGSSHVEFRYMGGSGYSQNYKGIKNTIASYSYWLSLANDPEFKKNEYIHKITRILNKIELFQSMYDLAYVTKYKEEDDNIVDGIKLDVLKDKYQKDVNKLKKIYKIDKKTMRLLYDNKPFINKIHKDITTKINKVVKEQNINISSFDVLMRLTDNK